MMQPNSPLHSTVQWIGDLLSSMYGGLPPDLSPFICANEQLPEYLNLPTDRAQTLVFQEGEELHLSIYIPTKTEEAINQSSPIEKLEEANLDPFFQLLEEMSHFSLIVNRTNQERSTKKVELEWQGEVDKLWIAQSLLRAQGHSKAHYSLFELIHHQFKIVSEESHYQDADRLAQKFWHYAGSRIPNIQLGSENPSLGRLLNFFYELNWEDKVLYLNQPESIAV